MKWQNLNLSSGPLGWSPGGIHSLLAGIHGVRWSGHALPFLSLGFPLCEVEILIEVIPAPTGLVGITRALRTQSMLPALGESGVILSPFRGEHRDRKTREQRSDQGQPAQDATVSVTACEGPGREHRLEGGQTHLPTPPSLGHQGAHGQHEASPGLGSVSSRTRFPPPPGLTNGVFKRPFPPRWPPSPPLPGTCSHPRAFALAGPSARGASVSLFAP